LESSSGFEIVPLVMISQISANTAAFRENWPYSLKSRLRQAAYTNDCLKLRVAACYPFGKTSCFSKMGALFGTRIHIIGN
jgi:hypothetical protein